MSKVIKSTEQLQSYQHDASHRPILTRRDFFAQTAGTVAGAMMVPSALTMFSAAAKGQDAGAQLQCDSGAGGSGIPVFNIELAGGWGVARVVNPHGPAGAGEIMTAAAARTMGMTDAMRGAAGYYRAGTQPGAANSGIGAFLRTDTSFFRGLYDGLGGTLVGGALPPPSAAQLAAGDYLGGLDANVRGILDRIRVGSVIVRNVDDTANNQLFFGGYLFRSGFYRGSMVNLIGTDNTQQGARSAVPVGSLDGNLRSARFQSAADLTGLVSVGALALVQQGQAAQFLSPQDIQAVMAQASRMSDSKIREFASRDFSDQMNRIMKCGYIKQQALLASAGGALDPAADNAITTSYGAGALATAQQPSIVKALIDRLAVVGSVVLGGYDYHAQGDATTNTRDEQAGLAVGRAIRAAHIRATQSQPELTATPTRPAQPELPATNRPFIVTVTTDGSVSANNPAGPDAPAWAADSGERHMDLIFAYHPNANNVSTASSVFRQQIGAFNPATGGVDLGFNDITNSQVNATICMAANILELQGQYGRLETALGTAPPWGSRAAFEAGYRLFAPFPTT